MPVRLAYDKSSERSRFERSVKYLAEEGFTDFSTYVLYNHDESPTDFYERIAHCNELNQRLGIQIYSFPMRFTPLGHKDRNYVGEHWKRKLIGGLQRVLNVTKGVIAPGGSFFLRAYGKTPDDFEEICAMPDHYILNRDVYEENEAAEWRGRYRKLSRKLRDEFLDITSIAPFNREKIIEAYEKASSKQIKVLLEPFLQPVAR